MYFTHVSWSNRSNEYVAISLTITCSISRNQHENYLYLFQSSKDTRRHIILAALEHCDHNPELCICGGAANFCFASYIYARPSLGCWSRAPNNWYALGNGNTTSFWPLYRKEPCYNAARIWSAHLPFAIEEVHPTNSLDVSRPRGDEEPITRYCSGFPFALFSLYYNGRLVGR